MPDTPNLYEKLTGKRTGDIYLPAESGKRDPRLPPPNSMDKIRTLSEVASSTKPLEGLQNFGRSLVKK